MNPGGYVVFKAIKEIFGFIGVGWVMIVSSGLGLCWELAKGPRAERRPGEMPWVFKIAGYSLTLVIGIAVVVWYSLPVGSRSWHFGKGMRFEKDLPAYLALMPVLAPEGARQPGLPQATGMPGKVKGKMVVVNVNEKGIDDLHFDLPRDLSASKPEEVSTVVLLTWEKRDTSSALYTVHTGRYAVVGHVRVFDWASKSEIASRMFFGDPPEHPYRPGTGPRPDDQVLKFLTSLPRQ